MTEGLDTTCQRCGREARGWLVHRGGAEGKCSPKRWVYCIRDPFDVMRENYEREAANA